MIRARKKGSTYFSLNILVGIKFSPNFNPALVHALVHASYNGPTCKYTYIPIDVHLSPIVPSLHYTRCPKGENESLPALSITPLPAVTAYFQKRKVRGKELNQLQASSNWDWETKKVHKTRYCIERTTYGYVRTGQAIKFTYYVRKDSHFYFAWWSHISSCAMSMNVEFPRADVERKSRQDYNALIHNYIHGEKLIQMILGRLGRSSRRPRAMWPHAPYLFALIKKHWTYFHVLTGIGYFHRPCVWIKMIWYSARG